MLNLLLQAQQPDSTWSTLFFLAFIFVVFYFFMIRPQQKKQKEQKTFRENLKKGDVVVTIGGIHGTISSIEADDTLIIEVDRGMKLKIEKWGISAEASKKDKEKK